MFTTAFDDFTPADFSHWIYNDRYIEADHEYADIRPRYNADAIKDMFGAHKDISVLDYGGGSGLLGQLLRNCGFSDVDSYDPFVAEFARRPERRYAMVLAFEVIEHSTKPREVFADLVSLTAPGGIIVFSTMVQTAEIQRAGVQWWYVSPRNGHVSFHSGQSMKMLADEHGLQWRTNSEGSLHVMHTTIPDFAQKVLRRPVTPAPVDTTRRAP